MENTTTTETTVQLTKADIINYRSQGWTIDKLAQHYSLSPAQMRLAMKDVGISTREGRGPIRKFTFTDVKTHTNESTTAPTV